MLDIAGEEKFYGINAAERNLASKLASFDEVLLDFAGDLYPHKVYEYNRHVTNSALIFTLN